MDSTSGDIKSGLTTIVAAVKEPVFHVSVELQWEESMRCLPQSPLDFLAPRAVHDALDWCGIDFAWEPRLLRVAQHVDGHPALRRLAWHGYRRLCFCPDSPGFENWPELKGALGDDFGVFYLLLALATVPLIREIHQKMGIPEEITRDTCSQINSCLGNHLRFMQGQPGFLRKPLYWLRHYLQSGLFRTGRMEYMLRKYETLDNRVRVYRHQHTRRALALANDGLQLTSDGYLHWEESESPAGLWTSRLETNGNEIVGHLASPWGFVMRQEARLPTDEWKCELSGDDYVMDMHIPAGGGMTRERFLDSMRRGAQFFHEFFPKTPFTAIRCDSWIFAPQLEGMLPSDAHLVECLREVYLYPGHPHPESGLFFLFGPDKFDHKTAPRDTSVQRAMLNYLATGRRWSSGGMFVLVEDLPELGDQFYRRQWGEWMPVTCGAPTRGRSANGSRGLIGR